MIFLDGKSLLELRELQKKNLPFEELVKEYFKERNRASAPSERIEAVRRGLNVLNSAVFEATYLDFIEGKISRKVAIEDMTSINHSINKDLSRFWL